MQTNSNNPSGGIGFFGLLTIVFITLRLTGHIAWSWFWVLSPMLIPFIIMALVLLTIFLFAVFGGIKSERRRRY